MIGICEKRFGRFMCRKVQVALNYFTVPKSMGKILSIMKMKIGLLAMVFLSTIVVKAQDKSNEDRAKALTERMKENLTLKDDQYEKVYTINLAFMNKAMQVRNSGGGRLGKARKLKEADGERDKMLKGVLTEEQFKKFKEQKSENRKEMKKRMDERKQ